jgi:hypothetical protein
MFTHPHIASQLASERQRDLLAAASRQRQARQLRGTAAASQRAGRPRRRLAGAFRFGRRPALPA